MNLLGKVLAELHPTFFLNRRTDRILSERPTGIHPVRKYVYRRECREMLGSYQNMLERRMEGRILGNKSVSPWTKRKIEQLKEVAR